MFVMQAHNNWEVPVVILSSICESSTLIFATMMVLPEKVTEVEISVRLQNESLMLKIVSF